MREGTPVKNKLIYSIPLLETVHLKFKVFTNSNNIVFSYRVACV